MIFLLQISYSLQALSFSSLDEIAIVIIPAFLHNYNKLVPTPEAAADIKAIWPFYP